VGVFLVYAGVFPGWGLGQFGKLPTPLTSQASDNDAVNMLAGNAFTWHGETVKMTQAPWVQPV